MESNVVSINKNKTAAPVVDVPREKETEKRIKAFEKTNAGAITHYVQKNFTVSAEEVDQIIRECAECSVLKRTPKKGGPWGDETQVIEEILTDIAKSDVAAKEPKKPKADVKARAKPVVEDLDDEEEEPLGDGTEDADFPVEEEEAEEDGDDLDERQTERDGEESQGTGGDSEQVESSPSSSSQSSETSAVPTRADKAKEASPKASKPSKAKPTKQAKATKTGKAKTATTEKKAAVKSKPKTPQTKSMKGSSVETLKGLKGRELWFAAARHLKSKSAIWIQTQDIEEVIGHLYEVSTGKAKLKAEGFPGKGARTYRINRLNKIFKAITDLLAEVAGE